MVTTIAESQFALPATAPALSLIKELGERKLKPSEKQHLKGQITTLINLL